MTQRLSLLMRSALAAAVGLFAVAATLTAQPPAAKPPENPKSVGDLKSQEELNAELFRKFQRELLNLAQKLDRSEAPEDKDRAKVIYAALDLAKKEGLEGQFAKLIAAMGKGSANLQDIEVLSGQDKQLTKALQDILAILMTDDETARIKAEIARLEEYLKQAREIKRQQEILRAMTEAKKSDNNKLSKSQNDLANRTKDLDSQMGGNKKDAGKQGDGKGGEKALAKSEPKPEAKPGDDAGKGKSDTDQAKGESKDGTGGDPMKGDGAEAKPGGKDGKPMDGAGSAKPAPKGDNNDQAGSSRDGGEPKDGQGSPKDGQGNPKDGQGNPKDGQGNPKDGQGNPKDGQGGSKDGQGNPKDGQGGSKDGQGGSKDGQPKDGQGGSKDGQGGKPSESKGGPQGDGKSQGKGKGDDKGSQGQQGGESKNKNDQEPKDQQGGSKGGGQSGDGEPKQGGGGGGGQQQPQQPQQPGRKQLQEAYPFQKDAVPDLEQNKREDAGKKEDKAIEKLAQAIKELEKRLKQLREEEMLKTLAALEARCNRMLVLQIEVYEATKAIDGVIAKNNGQKTNADVQKSLQQADKEGEIVLEAAKALKLLESEGSAVAFATVLAEVREDMIAVQRRLADSRVDKDTQAIEENIIALLKDMILALKKAQQEMQQQQGQPPPPGQQKPGNKKLIDLLAELKLIKALQLQVNGRTKMYGDKTPGEQSADPILQAELKQLSQRQQKLQEMLNKIATGENQ